MNIIELYSGTSDLTKELRKRGHNVIDIDWDESTPAMVHCDISKLTLKDLEDLMEKFFGSRRIDFIWASPDCTTYSIAGLWYHRYTKQKDEYGNMKPKSEYAKQCDEYNKLLWGNILNKARCPYIVENPVGKYQALRCITAPYKVRLLYSWFGALNEKPTYYFTNSSHLESFLKNAPHDIQKQTIGVQDKNGGLERGKVPHLLISNIADFIELYGGERYDY